MERITFVLKAKAGCFEEAEKAVAQLTYDFKHACTEYGIHNFSVWKMEEYFFGYGESDSFDPACFDSVFSKLPEYVPCVCRPGTMRMMYHDYGIIREDKSLIRHRVFATRIHPGCEEEYKRRHDGLVEARGDKVTEGPESDFTIWYGDGCIFGYCELVRAYDAIAETPEQHAATVAWETRGLEIMDWITDDVDWLTGLKHNSVKQIM